MNYNLNKLTEENKKKSTYASLKSLLQLISHEKKNLLLALMAILTQFYAQPARALC